jgi:cell division protein FtsW (lipid II flippase)
MLGTLLTLFLVGLVALFAIGIALSLIGAVFGIAFGVAGFLLFKVAPILLVGWVILKVIDRARNRNRISASDERWLDS